MKYEVTIIHPITQETVELVIQAASEKAAEEITHAEVVQLSKGHIVSRKIVPQTLSVRRGNSPKE